MQHTAAVWNCHHALRYYSYVILEGDDLKDAEVFVYGTSFGRMVGLTQLDSGETSDREEEYSNTKIYDGANINVHRWELDPQNTGLKQTRWEMF